MQKIKTTRIILYVLGYLLFLTFGIVFLVLLINTKQHDFNRDLIAREHEQSTKRLGADLKLDYGNFLVYYNTYAQDDEWDTATMLESNLANINKDLDTEYGFKYYVFGLKTDEGIRLAKNSAIALYKDIIITENDPYYNKPVTVFNGKTLFKNELLSDKSYIMFSLDNVVGIIDASEYFNNYRLNFSYAQKGMLTTKEQIILYGNFDDTPNTLDRVMGRPNGFYDLFDSPDDTYVLTYKFNDEALYAASTKLEVFKNNSDELLTGNLYVVHTYTHDLVFISTNEIFSIVLLFIIITIVLIIIAQLIIYRFLAIKNADIESSRLLHYYQKPLIVFLNRNGRVVGFNKSFKELIPNLDDYKHIDDFLLSADLISSNNLALLYKQSSFDAHFRDGKNDITVRFIPVKKIRGYDLIGEDVTNRDQHFQTYRSLALYHQTTGLPNLSYFKATLNNKITNSTYMKQNHGLVLLNISNFRNINRILGEQTADTVLKALSDILRKNSNEKMTLYNTFMDYFLIHFENITSNEEIDKWVNELVVSLEKPLEVALSKINLQLKIGIYHCNFENTDLELINADVIYERVMGALNQARNTDKEIVVYDANIGQSVEYQKQMELDLRKAIDNDEFILHLQPQYNSKLKRIVSFEALIRWDNPKYEFVSPQIFISLAETNNLIIEIGHLVMKKTFELVKRLEKYKIQISMNISPVQVLQAGFINEFMDLYNQYDIKPNSVAIEITETFLMSSFDIVIDKLKILQKNGINIHLDDFGTGNSSLLYLKELPIDTIKIDRGFVMHLPQDKYSKAIINMIIALAKNLELNIIAEGVENNAQNQFLSKAGCDVIQGWLISKARPIDEIIELLEKSDKIVLDDDV